MNKSVKTWLTADNGKTERVIEFASGKKVAIPVNKNGCVKWFDDSALIKKGAK